MRRYALSLAAALLTTAAVPSLAAAADAVTTVDLNMRAGPSTGFPVVEVVPDDARVTVYGCVSGYQWCDVSWRDARGWVYGPHLSSLYSGRYVPLVEYSAGLPIIGFSVDTYWNSYYRDRPWYGQRARWRYTWRDNRGDRREDRADRRDDRRENRAERRDDRRDARVERRGENRADRRDDRRDARVERRGDNRAERRENRPGMAMEGRGENRAQRGQERREMRAERGGEPRGNAGRGGEARERGNSGGSRPGGGGGERGGGGGRGGREG